MTTQPKALRLADFLDDQYDPSHNLEEAEAELRRLHMVNQELGAARAALRDALAQEEQAEKAPHTIIKLPPLPEPTGSGEPPGRSARPRG
jgi:hypothetical protein